MFVCCCHSNNIPPVPTKEDVKDDEAQQSSIHTDIIKEESQNENKTPSNKVSTHNIPSNNIPSNNDSSNDTSVLAKLFVIHTLSQTNTLAQTNTPSQTNTTEIKLSQNQKLILTNLQDDVIKKYNSLIEQFNIEQINECIKIKNQILDISTDDTINNSSIDIKLLIIKQLKDVKPNENIKVNTNIKVDTSLLTSSLLISSIQTLLNDIDKDILQKEIEDCFDKIKLSILEIIDKEKQDKKDKLTANYKLHPLYQKYIELYINYIL